MRGLTYCDGYFPFCIQQAEIWDGSTYFVNSSNTKIKSNSPDKITPVVGPGTKFVKMPIHHATELYWRIVSLGFSEPTFLVTDAGGDSLSLQTKAINLENPLGEYSESELINSLVCARKISSTRLPVNVLRKNGRFSGYCIFENVPLLFDQVSDVESHFFQVSDEPDFVYVDLGWFISQGEFLTVYSSEKVATEDYPVDGWYFPTYDATASLSFYLGDHRVLDDFAIPSPGPRYAWIEQYIVEENGVAVRTIYVTSWNDPPQTPGPGETWILVGAWEEVVGFFVEYPGPNLPVKFLGQTYYLPTTTHLTSNSPRFYNPGNFTLNEPLELIPNKYYTYGGIYDENTGQRV